MGLEGTEHIFIVVTPQKIIPKGSLFNFEGHLLIPMKTVTLEFSLKTSTAY